MFTYRMEDYITFYHITLIQSFIIYCIYILTKAIAQYQCSEARPVDELRFRDAISLYFYFVSVESIIEQFGLAGAFKDHLQHSPCSEQGQLHQAAQLESSLIMTLIEKNES